MDVEALGYDIPSAAATIRYFAGWADKVEGALRGVDCVRIEMSHVDEGRRGICFEGAGEHILEALK